MNKYDVYLDWCPRPTNSFCPVVFGDPGSQFQIDAVVNCAIKRGLPIQLVRENVEAIQTAYRTDGLFLFSICWNSGEIDQHLKYNIASLVSLHIKECLGHTHVFNNSRHSNVRGNDWQPLHKNPAQVSGSFAEAPDYQELEQCLQSSSRLVELKADFAPWAQTSSEDERSQTTKNQLPGLLRLRQSYVALFEKAVYWTRTSNERIAFGLPIYRSTKTYILTFVASVFFWTILKMSESSPPSGYAHVLAGVAGSLVALIVLALIAAAWNKGVRPFAVSITRQILNLFRMRHAVAISSYTSYIKRVTPKFGQVRFFIGFTAIFGSSVSIYPTFPDIPKFFKSNYTDNILSKLESTWGSVDFHTSISNESFWTTYLMNLGYYSPLLVATFFLLDVQTKRKRTRRVLTHLKAHLLYGNILSHVIRSTYLRSSQPNKLPQHEYSTTGTEFEDAIRLTDMLLLQENQKRKRVIWMLAIASTPSLLLYLSDYLSFAL